MKRSSRFGVMVTVGVMLAGCTAIHPPGIQGMPDKGSIASGGEVTVGKNENVYGIAHKNGVSMRELIVLNDLKAPFAVRAGQTLKLPAKDGQAGYTAGGTMAPTPIAAPMASIEAEPLDGGGPVSSSVITSAPIDPPQSLPKNDVVVANKEPPPIDKPFKLGPPKPVATTVTPMANDKPLVTKNVIEKNVPGPHVEPSDETPVAEAPVKELAAKEVVAPKEMAAKEVPAKTAALSRSNPGFTWPVQGPILSGFGPKEQGLNNDGINIGAPKSAPVVAAAGGIVVYAGNEMKGFGNLVLIRHEGGWVTAYAHLDRVMVSRDSVLAAGDMIGTVGTTGGVGSPQLHFETRYEGKPIDPQTVIKKAG